MKTICFSRFSSYTLVISALGALLASTPANAANQQVPLKGEFYTIHHDTFGFNPQIGPFVSVVVEGEGKLSHLGRTTCFTDDQLGVLTTGALTATYTFTAANGDTIIAYFSGPSEIDFATQTVTFDGEFVIQGGTGRFENATGSGTFSGWAVFLQPFGLPTNEGPGFFALEGTLSK